LPRLPRISHRFAHGQEVVQGHKCVASRPKQNCDATSANIPTAAAIRLAKQSVCCAHARERETKRIEFHCACALDPQWANATTALAIDCTLHTREQLWPHTGVVCISGHTPVCVQLTFLEQNSLCARCNINTTVLQARGFAPKLLQSLA
jgi:hypothetical protein